MPEELSQVPDAAREATFSAGYLDTDTDVDPYPELKIDFDIEGFLQDSKRVEGLGSAVLHRVPEFANLKKGSADFRPETGLPNTSMIEFKDKDGNLAQIKFPEQVYESMFPKLYAEYTAAIAAYRKVEDDADREKQHIAWQKAEAKKRELFEKMKRKLTEVGFDLQLSEEERRTLELAFGVLRSERAQHEVDTRYRAKKEIEI